MKTTTWRDLKSKASSEEIDSVRLQARIEAERLKSGQEEANRKNQSVQAPDSEAA